MMIRLPQHMALAVLRDFEDRYGKNNEVVQTITDQISNPRHFSDLVDTICAVLGAPNAKLVLNGIVLQQLRTAIFSPRELATVSAKTKTWQACSNCGAEIAQGEIATFRKQNPLCYKCGLPTLIRCNTCKDYHEIPTGVVRVLTKLFKECAVTKVEKVLAPKQPEPGGDRIIFTGTQVHRLDRPDAGWAGTVPPTINRQAADQHRHRLEELFLNTPTTFAIPPGEAITNTTTTTPQIDPIHTRVRAPFPFQDEEEGVF